MINVDSYAVIGNPIAHSLSPQIHQSFAQQTGQSLAYSRLPAAIDDFVQTVQQFWAQGGRGLNVTVPFKEQAFQLADHCSERAQAAGAVNTLIVGEGGVRGDNTDGVGLVRDLQQRLGVNLKDAQVVILGAGGAARGIVLPLASAGVAHVLVANRTVARADKLVADLAQALGSAAPSCVVQAVSLASLQGSTTIAGGAIWLNSTATGLHEQSLELPGAALGEASLAYDLVYSASATPFMQLALQAGCAQVSDGLGMLVEQAAESFYLWRGVRPETKQLLHTLRAQLASPPRLECGPR